MAGGAKSPRRTVSTRKSKAPKPPDHVMADAMLAMDAAIDEVKEKLHDCL